MKETRKSRSSAAQPQDPEKKKPPIQKSSISENVRRIIVKGVDDQKGFAVDRDKIRKECKERHMSQQDINKALKRASACKSIGYPQARSKSYMIERVSRTMMASMSCWREEIEMAWNQDKGWKNIETIFLRHKDRDPSKDVFSNRLDTICRTRHIYEFAYRQMERLFTQMQEPFEITLNKFREEYGVEKLPYCAFLNYYSAGKRTYVPEHSDTTVFGTFIICLAEGSEDEEDCPLEIQATNGFQSVRMVAGDFVAFPALKHRIQDNGKERKAERASLVMFW
jgi:hypothetical protein